MSAPIELFYDDVAGQVAAVLAQAASGGRCSVALAGGHTPRPLYRRIAGDIGTRIDWSNVHVFFGDERLVPAMDPASNYTMARESLLDRVAIPADNIHPVRADLGSPNAAAEEYEHQLRRSFGDTLPRFDLILLGMGADGHTASLFPHSRALTESNRWVVATEAPVEPRDRITLTLPVINNAAHVFFIVEAKGKEQALEHARADDADTAAYPAAAVKPTRGELEWFVMT